MLRQELFGKFLFGASRNVDDEESRGVSFQRRSPVMTRIYRTMEAYTKRSRRQSSTSSSEPAEPSTDTVSGVSNAHELLRVMVYNDGLVITWLAL